MYLRFVHTHTLLGRLTYSTNRFVCMLCNYGDRWGQKNILNDRKRIYWCVVLRLLESYLMPLAS